MILIACIDDCFGMAFNKRRQSRDSALCADIIATVSCAPLHMSPRSAPLFEDAEAKVISCPDYLENCGDGEYCFLEFESPSPYADRIEKIILYRWNRRYPSDLKFDIPLELWQLESAAEFAGSSHEKISKEVYIRE